MPKGTDGFLGRQTYGRQGIRQSSAGALILMSAWCEFASTPEMENLDAHMLITKFITSPQHSHGFVGSHYFALDAGTSNECLPAGAAFGAPATLRVEGLPLRA